MRRLNPIFPAQLRILYSLIVGAAICGCSASTESPEVSLERAAMLQARGEFEDAILAFTAAEEDLSDFPDLYFDRAVCYEALQLHEKALSDYTRCLELIPQYTDAMNNRGVVLAKLGRYEQAAEQFSDLLEQMPDNVLAYRNRGLCYHDLGQHDKAMADYNRGITIAPQDTEALFQRGNLFLDLNSLPEAEADFSKVIELIPEHARAWMNRGVARYQLGQREPALADLNRAHELDDNIVIPDLDWLDSNSKSQTVARPILPGQELWQQALQYSISQISSKGYSDIRAMENFPSSNCALLTAKEEETKDDVRVYVSLSTDPNASQIRIAADRGDAPEVKRVLMVVSPAREDIQADSDFEVIRFEEAWTPDKNALFPVINRLQLK